MRFLYQGKVYAAEQEIEIEDVNYVPGRLMPEERTALGITEVIEQPMPDLRYGYANEDPATPGAWIFTPFPPEQLKKKLIDHAAAVRYGIESAPVDVTVAGAQVPMSPARGDDRAALHITFSAIASGLRKDTDVFKFADGVGRAATNAEMQAAIMTALARVQTAFDKEKTVVDQIAAGGITTYEAVEAAFSA